MEEVELKYVRLDVENLYPGQFFGQFEAVEIGTLLMFKLTGEDGTTAYFNPAHVLRITPISQDELPKTGHFADYSTLPF